MAEETKTYVFGNEGGNGNLPLLAAMNNGGGFFGNGFGTGFFGGLLGGLFTNIFGNGFYGNGFGGGNGAAASLGAQATANNNTDLLLQAITAQGEQSRQAVQTLSNNLNQDFNVVNTQVQAISSILNNMAVQNAMTPLQVINAIQSGNASLSAQFAQCCCENRLLTTQQGYESQIRTLEQTNQLGSQADKNTNSVIQAINAQTVAMNEQFCAVKERELQNQINAKDEIIAQLRTQASNQTILNQVAAMLAPLQSQINYVASRQPNTVPVVWPQLNVTEATTATTTVASN